MNKNTKKFRKLLGAKIHRATVTQAELHYEGSITIPPHLLEAADIVDYEAVQVWNVTKGTRLETYAISGAQDSKDICVNGAAAHLAKPGDLVIIASFVDIAEDEVPSHVPRLVFVDENNQIKHLGPEIPGPAERKSG